MTTTMHDTIGLEADTYLKQVAAFLGVVPAEERDEMLDDLAEHLREISAEPGFSIAERLGPAKSYADELLASAGYAPDPPVASVLSKAASMGGRLAARLTTTAIGREIGRLRPAITPAWWILRAYLAVSLVAALESGRASHAGFPIPRLANNPAIGLLAVLVAIPLSVRLGQRGGPAGWWQRAAAVAVTAALVVYALSLFARVGRSQVTYVQAGAAQPTSGCLTDGAGQDITNLYAYGPDGTLLSPVLLYDQDGQPIDNLCPYFDSEGRPLSTTYAHDVNGAPVYNAFPRAQTVPGLPGQANPTVPVTPPAVVIPRLAPTTTVPPSGTATTVTPSQAAATTVPPGGTATQKTP